jgi:hypothetical protein
MPGKKIASTSGKNISRRGAQINHETNEGFIATKKSTTPVFWGLATLPISLIMPQKFNP